MKSNEHQRFLDKLEEKYGEWSQATARFGKSSYGEISKALNISASQFSKLLYGSATEGMYIRSIDNINRLLHQEEVQKEYQQALDKLNSLNKNRFRQLLFVFLFTALAVAYLAYWYAQNKIHSSGGIGTVNDAFGQFFEQEYNAAFDSPFLPESLVQEYCPCSAFEGKWNMEAPYKLPLPASGKPGLYYQGKKSELWLRCTNINSPYVEKGKAMFGYELLTSEIWIDTKQEALIPRYFDLGSKVFTSEFDRINFDQNPQFKKVAVLQALNFNNFEIYPDSIIRRAELTGRYVVEKNDEVIQQFGIELKHIVRNVLGNLIRTDCSPTVNPFCNPNDLKEGESIISFDCVYTIEAENLGLGGGYPYEKSFRLVDQNYSDFLNCRCGDY